MCGLWVIGDWIQLGFYSIRDLDPIGDQIQLGFGPIGDLIPKAFVYVSNYKLCFAYIS